MLYGSKIAILALIGAFTMGFAVAPVSAAGNHGQNRTHANGGDKAKSAHKAGYKLGRKRYRSEAGKKLGRKRYRAKAGKKRVRVVPAHYRPWRPGPPRWVPAPRYRWKYKQRRRNLWYWHSHRRYRHKHWRTHRHGGGNELTAGLIGAAIGAVLASQISYSDDRTHVTLNGVTTGAVIGSEIGRSMDRDDQDQASNVLETSRTDHSVEWQNADTSNRYTMTPTRTYRNARGQDCRDYTIWGWVDGFEENLNGTACRSAGGGWQLTA